MALVQIEKVSLAPGDREQLWGHSIDQPKAGNTPDVYCFEIMGWVAAKNCQVTGVEILADGDLLYQNPVNLPRPDVMKAFPRAVNGEYTGFRIPFNGLCVDVGFSLQVQVVLQNQNRVLLGTIHGRREPLRTSFEPRIQPIMLTCLGRCGSTWITRLLGSHPQVIAYRPFQFEPRVGSYWMEILKSLAEPASYLQMLAPTKLSGTWWLSSGLFPNALAIPDQTIRTWLGREAIQNLAQYCQSCIESFYTKVGQVQNNESPRYHIE